ncbi:MAG: type II secretion system protein GspL [Pseudomonadota bacterium]
MSTLYIRLASKAAADSTPQWLALACPFALVSHSGAIEREGVTPLSELSGTIAGVQRVVLILAGSDVTVLRVKVPPISPAKLKAALPGLVEEQLLCDPADCVIVAGALSDRLRTIAVVQRAWLDQLARTFISFGARQIAALPAQYCLSSQPGMVTAAIHQRDTNIDLTLRLSEQDGIGLVINAEPGVTSAHEVLHTLSTVVPAAPVTVFVSQENMHAYQKAAADTPALKERISITADNWTRWIAGAQSAELDLMAGLGAGASPKLDWHAWRWPLALAAAVLLINIGALNIDWWRMKREAGSLRSAMIQIYKSAYPNETVIIDPIAQMQQKITAAKRDSGQAAADDFTSITAVFGEAWRDSAATLTKPSSIAALEYRDRGLLVRFKPDGEAPALQIKAALAKRHLSLELAPEQSGAVVWRIRSAQ